MRTIETGASMLNLSLHAHQLALGDLLDTGAETTAVCWPRRSGKTTATWAWLLGRCAEVPDSMWVTTAQTGIKARDRFMAVARLLERHFPEDAGGPHVYRGAGHEALEFDNGSRLVVVAPKGEAFRGEGASVYVDEPQEFDVPRSDDLRQAVYPLLASGDARVGLVENRADGTISQTQVFVAAHNEYVQAAFELGIQALALIMAFLAAAAVAIWRGKARPEVAAGIVAAAVGSFGWMTFHVPPLALIGVAWIGIWEGRTG